LKRIYTLFFVNSGWNCISSNGNRNFDTPLLPRFNVLCSVLAFYVFSTQRRQVESRDGCAACVESFSPNNFCPPREVVSRASVLALLG